MVLSICGYEELVPMLSEDFSVQVCCSPLVWGLVLEGVNLLLNFWKMNVGASEQEILTKEWQVALINSSRVVILRIFPMHCVVGGMGTLCI